MTHTIEVQQVARTIARALNLNEDLTEAIAIGHDLGHTPFGHAGEEALSELLPDGFRHNEQSLRIVELLERDGAGLNLTVETRDGILKHSKERQSIAAEAWGSSSTLEGQIVKIADSIAYLNHDIQDAVRAGLISEHELPGEARRILGGSHSRRIDTLVTDCVSGSTAAARGEAPAEDTAQRPRCSRPLTRCGSSCSSASISPRRRCTPHAAGNVSCGRSSATTSRIPTRSMDGRWTTTRRGGEPAITSPA